MTRTHSIATNSTYTDILAQNHESYLQLRRQQRTILSSTRTPRVRRRDSNLAAPSFSKRFKTRYVPLTKKVLIHNVSPRGALGRQALHKAFSAPAYQSHLNGRQRPRHVDHKHVFRYKTLRAKKRPAELLPRPPTRNSTCTSSVPKSSSEITVSSSSVPVPVLPSSPADPVALCISNIQSDSTPAVGIVVNSQENHTGKIFSYAEYWLETSKAELKKLKEPLKKQTAALENVAQKMVRPTSSGYKKVRGYMHRDSHKPHFPNVFSTVFRANAQKAQNAQPQPTQTEPIPESTTESMPEPMPTSDTSQAPQAPPATGASSEQLCVVQKSRNMLALQKVQGSSSSTCASGHSEGDGCVVCQFLEHANLQRQELFDSGSGSASMVDSLLVKSAPGRMFAGWDRVRLPVPMGEASVSPREAGIVLIQQVLEYLRSTGNANSGMVSGPLASESYMKSSGLQYTAYSSGLVRRPSNSSIHSGKHSLVHEPALGALIKMLIETLQSLPNGGIVNESEGNGNGTNVINGGKGNGGNGNGGNGNGGNGNGGNGNGTNGVSSQKSIPESDSSSSSDTASETNPEANFNNQIVPSIFGLNYLVLSPISSFDGSLIDTPEPIENECGFLDLRTGPSRLLKQVRFIVDEEFNAQDTSVTWCPQSNCSTLGSFRNSDLQGYLMELGGSDETLVLQSGGVPRDDASEDQDNFSEFGYQMLATHSFAFASDESLDSGYFTARSSKASVYS